MHEYRQTTNVMTPIPKYDDNEIRNALSERILRVTEGSFDELALDIFRYQFTYNPIYQEFCRLLNIDVRKVQEPNEIPFLPIALFKNRDISTNEWKPEVVFESSTTTGQQPSRHAVRDLTFYRKISRRGFASVTGHAITDFLWLALLPSYVDRPVSSLISMVSYFISEGKPGSRFISMDDAGEILRRADRGLFPVAFISVSFALLDLAEMMKIPLHHTTIIETGGMKGRRSELTRQELHERICIDFDVSTVYSEYGMTELLSQGWSTGEGIFHPSPSLRILIRDLSDPMNLLKEHSRGAINCIDLANLDTCAFIATDDVGMLHENGGFEVLGRFDASELRGCNLMVDQGRNE